jgi:hypothetical protein
MSVKDTINIEVKMKVDPFEVGRIMEKLTEIRSNIWNQPTEDFTVTVQGDKVKV